MSVTVPRLRPLDTSPDLLAGTDRRILRVLERDGVDGEDDPLAADDPLVAMLGAASICSRIATGPEAGQPWRRLGDRVEPVDEDEAGIELRATVPPPGTSARAA